MIDSAIDWTGGTGFLTSPSSAELLEGETVTLSAEGYGPGDVTYQWKKNGGNIDGATGSSLILEAVAKDAAANYSVVVTSASGATAEATASVKVYNLQPLRLSLLWKDPQHQQLLIKLKFVQLVAQIELMWRQYLLLLMELTSLRI